jgi:hypothetical protein
MSKSNKKKTQPKQRSVGAITQAAVQKVEHAAKVAVKAAMSHGSQPKGGSRRGNPSKRRDNSQGKVYSLHVPLASECLGEVSTSIGFTNTDYIINPSNIRTFPRLSRIANNFEMYDFVKLAFRFVSSSGTAVGSTNTALGTVLANTNYDVLDSKFSSQIQMEDYGGISETMPSRNFTHVVNVRGIKGGIKAVNDSSRLLRYNLHGTSNVGAYPASSSAHDYDLGRFQFASVGAQAPSVAGRLYVDYSLNLHRWKTESATGSTAVAAHLRANPPITASTANPFGTIGLSLAPGSTLQVTSTPASLTLPLAGRFIVMFTWNGGSIASLPIIAHGANLSPIPAFNNGVSFSLSSFNTNVANYASVFDVAVSGNGPANTIIVSGLTGLTASNADVWISDVPAALPYSLPSSDDDDNEYEAVISRLNSLIERQRTYIREAERLATITEEKYDKSDAYDDCHETDTRPTHHVGHSEPAPAEALRPRRPGVEFVMYPGGSAPPLPPKPSMAASVLSSLGMA